VFIRANLWLIVTRGVATGPDVTKRRQVIALQIACLPYKLSLRDNRTSFQTATVDRKLTSMEMTKLQKFARLAALVVTLSFVSGFAECYKPVTKNQLPARIKTVAVPAFQNNALRYKIEHRFTKAVLEELIHRGRGLRVQGDREGADAVIEGIIKSYQFTGVLLDDKGRARIFEVTIAAAITVRDLTQNRVLYDNQNFVFRGEYEFANDPRNFFNEEDPAVQRMARSFAESIVSTLINAVELDK
jgi:hypothetical protein